MKCPHLALAIAIASGLSTAAAVAQTSLNPYSPATYEYGNYDYYSQPATVPTPPAVPPPIAAPPTPPPPVSNGCASSDSCASTPTCSSSSSCEKTEEKKDNCCKKNHCLPLIKCEECCPLKCEDKEICRIFDDCCCLKSHDMTITGWLSGGVVGTDRAPADRFNGPVTFPDRNGEGQLNQAWLALERAVPKDNSGFYLGGRVDYFYGSDYLYTTAAGLDGTPMGNIGRWDNNNALYGSALPQFYVETAFDDLKIKWGHFFTIIGYEVVPAIGNFFYTHTYTMQYGEPFTHTGILASKPLSDEWTFYGGITNGWDTFSADSRANFLGGLTYTQSDWGSLAFAIHTGGESINGPGVGPWANRTIYSIVWSRNWTSRLTYVLESDRGFQNRDPVALPNADWYGVNQYVFYRINCCWTAGWRIAWFRDQDGYRVTGLRPGNSIFGASFPGDFYECTLGLNWKPNGNLIVRPEARWDWYQGPGNQNPAVPVTSPFNAGTAMNQFLYGFDIIYQY
ncbi:MAG: porin [Pirellulales bacterium]|nr:porin [Pirellulales bacterium]